MSRASSDDHTIARQHVLRKGGTKATKHPWEVDHPQDMFLQQPSGLWSGSTCIQIHTLTNAHMIKIRLPARASP